MNEYLEFLQQKQKTINHSGFDISVDCLNNSMFDFQKFIVQRALKAGKYAIFADCGLGKTLMQLEWAYRVFIENKKPVLIIAPLAVVGQTIKEGEGNDPVMNENLPVDLWQKYASPVWMDIDYGNTLQGFRNGREENDEKHICPLQLGTIERLIHLYSNIGDTVLTPFMGIGSEVYQSVMMDRKAIGFELKESYFDIAKSNCKMALESKNQMSLF